MSPKQYPACQWALTTRANLTADSTRIRHASKQAESQHPCGFQPPANNKIRPVKACCYQAPCSIPGRALRRCGSSGGASVQDAAGCQWSLTEPRPPGRVHHYLVDQVRAALERDRRSPGVGLPGPSGPDPGTVVQGVCVFVCWYCRVLGCASTTPTSSACPPP